MDQKLLDTRKQVLLNVTKELNLEKEVAEVAIALDISMSMDNLLRNGFVQELLERIVPVAMQFDDNQSMELYLFESNAYKHKVDVTAGNIKDFVKREIYGKYRLGGTQYAPVIDMIRGKSTRSAGSGEAEPKSFIDKIVSFFKGGDSVAVEPTVTGPKAKYPKYVIFVTDGDCFDQSNAETAIRDASSQAIFWQFVGIGNAGFQFLDKLDTMPGRLVDNANFFHANDIKRISDQTLYTRLLTEYPSWKRDAQRKNIL